MRAVAFVFAKASRLNLAQRAGRLAQRPFVRNGSLRRLPPPLSRWTATRDLKPVARQSFRDWWRER
jgi:L-lactate dehydrogenase complex protein LldF